MYEVMVNTFHSQIQNRDTQITHLQQTINEDKHLKSKLEKKLVQKGYLKKESSGQRHGQSHCRSLTQLASPVDEDRTGVTSRGADRSPAVTGDGAAACCSAGRLMCRAAAAAWQECACEGDRSRK
jgi:hypothetical protein